MLLSFSTVGFGGLFYLLLGFFSEFYIHLRKAVNRHSLGSHFESYKFQVLGIFLPCYASISTVQTLRGLPSLGSWWGSLVLPSPTHGSQLQASPAGDE